MNHPENITFILVVYYFAKKKYEKQNETAILASFSLICTLFWYIVHLYAILGLYIRFEFSATKAESRHLAPCKNKYKFQNSEKTACFNQLPGYLNPGRLSLSTEGEVKVFMKSCSTIVY